MVKKISENSEKVAIFFNKKAILHEIKQVFSWSLYMKIDIFNYKGFFITRKYFFIKKKRIEDGIELKLKIYIFKFIS